MKTRFAWEILSSELTWQLSQLIPVSVAWSDHFPPGGDANPSHGYSSVLFAVLIYTPGWKEHSVPGQGSNTDRLICRLVHLPWSHPAHQTKQRDKRTNQNTGLGRGTGLLTKLTVEFMVLLVTWGPLPWKYFNKLPMDVNTAKADGWTLTRSCEGKKWITNFLSCCKVRDRLYVISNRLLLWIKHGSLFVLLKAFSRSK